MDSLPCLALTPGRPHRRGARRIGGRRWWARRHERLAIVVRVRRFSNRFLFVCEWAARALFQLPEADGRAGKAVMQVYVREEPDYSDLGIGDSVSLRAIEESGGYWTIRPPVTNDPVRLLTHWYCPRACFPEVVWARITVWTHRSKVELRALPAADFLRVLMQALPE